MTVEVALIGGGYVLQALAATLDPKKFVITSRAQETCKLFTNKGWNALQFDLGNIKDQQTIFNHFPDLKIVIDSVPPTNNLREDLNNFADLLLKQSIDRLIYLSTTGVYGATDGSWVTEESLLSPIHAQGEARVSSESIYFSKLSSSVALRLSAIYGPGRGTGLALKRGGYPYIENGSRWLNRIHVVDIVKTLNAILNLPKDSILPQAINLSDDSPALASEVVSFYCEKFNLSMPKSISLTEAKNLGIHSLLGNQRVSNKLLHDTLSLDFTYPDFSAGAGTEFS